jgi:hypothetical protein
LVVVLSRLTERTLLIVDIRFGHAHKSGGFNQ